MFFYIVDRFRLDFRSFDLGSGQISLTFLKKSGRVGFGSGRVGSGSATSRCRRRKTHIEAHGRRPYPYERERRAEIHRTIVKASEDPNTTESIFSTALHCAAYYVNRWIILRFADSNHEKIQQSTYYVARYYASEEQNSNRIHILCCL
jgi:hypothetical protein